MLESNSGFAGSSGKVGNSYLYNVEVEKFSLGPNDLMVEIGSNDGALLEAFQKQGIKVLGVDPTDVVQIALDKNLPTVPYEESLSFAGPIGAVLSDII